MVIPRKELPEIGELVIATVREIHDFGAYVNLDEYLNHRGFLPWSEVSSKWVKDIKEVVREGQKVVVKVIRVDRSKKEIDVSLKRISDTDRQRKMQWWKRYSKACKIIETAADKIGKTTAEAYREVVWRLEDKYSDVMYALEEALSRGPDVLRKAGIGEEWIEQLIEEATRHIKLKEVRVKYKLILQSPSPDGVERLKKCLGAISDYLDSQGVKHKLYVSGSPRYILEVYSSDYKTAETQSTNAIDRGESVAKVLGLIFIAEREKV
ncbi:MAG: translation initiation factor IF-2 subunit alpha [Desulfurococcaceae archaeon]